MIFGNGITGNDGSAPYKRGSAFQIITILHPSGIGSWAILRIRIRAGDGSFTITLHTAFPKEHFRRNSYASVQFDTYCRSFVKSRNYRLAAAPGYIEPTERRKVYIYLIFQKIRFADPKRRKDFFKKILPVYRMRIPSLRGMYRQFPPAVPSHKSCHRIAVRP